MKSKFKYALHGLIQLFSHEKSLQIHLVIAVVVILAGVLLDITRMEWMLILLCIGMVWVAEVFNSAIEKLCDLKEPHFHPQVKYIKDVSAAAVLISAIVSVIIGLIVFLPRLVDLFI